MKRFFGVILALLFAFPVFAQGSYDAVMRGGTTYYGRKDRSGKWAIQPQYVDTKPMTGGYRAFKDANGKWGVINSANQVTVPFVYDDILQRDGNGERYPFIVARKNGCCGLIAYDTHVVVCPFVYSDITFGVSGDAALYPSNGGAYTMMSKTELSRKLAGIKEAERKREQAELARKREAEALEKKEARLASFTAYAKQYVEPKVNDWQRKGEFETTAEYAARVTDAARRALISDLTAEAERRFIEEHAELNKNMPLTLGLYDADNQTFKLTSARFGDFFLPVPRAEAPDFKQRFSQFAPADVGYYIADDKIAVGEFLLRDASGKRSYRYDNSRSVVYNTYEIAYEKFDVQPIIAEPQSGGARVDEKRVVLQQPAVQTTLSPDALKYERVADGMMPHHDISAKPVLTILSPSDGGSYTQREVTVRYSVRSGDGGPAEIRVYIDGELYEPPTGKGVKAASNEVTLPLPQQPGKSCTVLLEAANSSGLMAQRKINLLYKGEQLKPRLHILSVGVGDYADAGIGHLDYASKDARDFVAAVMSRPKGRYSQVVEPILLTDRAATLVKVKSSLTALRRNAAQGDVVMLYFSGHAAEGWNKFFFLPADARKEDYFTTALRFDDIRETMEYLVELKCRVVIFMDTCHSGAMFNTRGAEDSFTIACPGIVGFYSSTRSEKSNESASLENGAFTRALVAGITGKAAGDRDEVTIQSLDSFIKREVDKATQGLQSPIVENGLGDFILF